MTDRPPVHKSTPQSSPSDTGPFDSVTCSAGQYPSIPSTDHKDLHSTSAIVAPRISPEEAQCLRTLYSLSRSANEKFLISSHQVDEFLEQYRGLPPGSSVKGDIATEINKRGVFLQTPILSACLAKISTHFVTLCDIASELLTSGYSESSKGNEVLILSQLVYCIGVGGDREKRILSASAQLAKIVDAFFDNNSIIDRYPDRTSAGWSNLIESLNLLRHIPEPLASSLYKVFPSVDTTKASLVPILPIIEDAPLTFFSYAPNPSSETVAALAMHLLTLTKTPHEQRKVARIISARMEEFYKQYPNKENPFTQPLIQLVSTIDKDPSRYDKTTKGVVPSQYGRPLEVSTFVSLLRLSCTLLECGEPRPFHQLCNAGSKRLLEVKTKTLLMTPLSEYPSLRLQEEAVRLRLEPLRALKGISRAKIKQSIEALSFAAENFDVPSLTQLFKNHLSPLVRGHVGLLGRVKKNDTVLSKEPDFTAAVSRVLDKLPRSKEVQSVQQVMKRLVQEKK